MPRKKVHSPEALIASVEMAMPRLAELARLGLAYEKMLEAQGFVRRRQRSNAPVSDVVAPAQPPAEPGDL